MKEQSSSPAQPPAGRKPRVCWHAVVFRRHDRPRCQAITGGQRQHPPRLRARTPRFGFIHGASCGEKDARLIRRPHHGDLDAPRRLLLHAPGRQCRLRQSWYATTEDGLEQQFALNYLAGFLLTYRLFSTLHGPAVAVIMTASQSHKGAHVHWDDLMLTAAITAHRQEKHNEY